MPHRACTRWAAWVLTWACAMWPASPNSLPRTCGAVPIPAAPALLREYDAWRRADRGGVIAFTDGLVRLFSSPLSVVRGAQFGAARLRSAAAGKVALSRLSTGGRRARSQACARCGVMSAAVAGFRRGHRRRGVIGRSWRSAAAGAQVECAGPCGGGGRPTFARRGADSGAARNLGPAGIRPEPGLGTAARALRRVEITAPHPGVRVRTHVRLGCRREAQGRGSLTFDCAEIGEPNLGYHRGRPSVLQWQCLQAARTAGAC